MIKTLLKISTSLALVAGIATAPASAATILSFGNSGTSTIVATNPTATSTAFGATDVSIGVTYLENASIPANTSLAAYFTVSALSSGSAFSIGNGVGQNFSGTFSIYTGTGLSGTNLLSGSFSDFAMFWGGENTAQLNAGSTSSFAFSSSVITSLASPLGFSLSLSDVTPDLHIVNGTIAPFSGSVSGTFSGSAVPEPASWALMVGGFGMLGATMRRRRPTVTARFV